MPIRRGNQGLSKGAGGNLFDRPGFFDYAEIDRLTVETTLLVKAASETYGIEIDKQDTSGASQTYTLSIPAMTADGEMVTTTSTQTLSNKTMVGLVIPTLNDSNGNEILDLNSVGSAVNYLQITNSATGNATLLNALGDDTNIDITLTPKGSGVVNITGNINVSGTSTTINSTTLDVDDKNITMGSVASPSDTTADGGGITLKGASDKTILWDNANDNWTSNQDWNLATGSVFRINNVSTLSNTTLGAAVINSSLTSTGALNSGSITSGFTSIDVGAGAISTTGAITGGSLAIDNISIDGNTISTTSGSLILDATTTLNLSDDSVINVGTLNIDAIHGDNNAIAIGDNSDDAVSLYRVTALTAVGDLDIGAHDFRAATLTADGLTATRVLFAGTNGVLTDDDSFEYNLSTNTLAVQNISNFTLSGKLTAGSTEIEGSNFDITGGTVAGVTATSLTLNSGTMGGSFTWNAAQDLNNVALSNVDINSGAINTISSFGIKQAATAYEMQIAVGSTSLTANRILSIDPNDAARTIEISGDLTFGNAFTTGSHALTLTTSGTTNVTFPTTGTLATIAGNETLTNKVLTTPTISSISNSGTITIPTGTDTLVGKATTDTLTNKSISGATNTLSAIGNSSLSNSAITIGGTATSLGGTITALTALTDLDMTSGNKTILDGVGSNTITIGASGSTVAIAGDLTVAGTTTTTNTTTVDVDDPLMSLASTNTSSDVVDIGFYGKYTDSGTKYAGFFRDADDSDKWKLFATTGNSNAAPTTTVNTTSGFTLGTLEAHTFIGALTGTASLATSAATWTNARTLSFTGDVTGTGSVNGSQDVATALTIDDDAVEKDMLNPNIISGLSSVGGSTDTANDYIMVWDATDSELKKSPLDGLGISGTAVGSANELQYNNSGSFAAAANVEIRNASLALKEMSAPNNVSGYGMLYAATNNELYFKDDGGNATQITNAGALAGGGAFKGVKAYLDGTSGAYAVNNNSATTSTTWTESYDVGAFHSGSTNTDRFTFGTTGYFLISIQQEWAADSAGYREMAVTLRDTSGSSNNVILRDRILAPSNQATAVSGGSTILYVDDSADYVTVQLYQNSGAALNAISDNDDSTFITISRLDMATQGSGTASGGSGHVQISDGAGGFTHDANAIFWDATNNRLGITTGSPAYSVDTTASGTIRTGTLTATALDISGDADIDGILEADAYTVAGTALNEYIADTVGAMVSSNTETNITVTYEDGDNTLDFVIGTLNQNTTGTAAGLSTELAVASGGTNTTSYTKGDILIASASTTLTKLGLGTDDYILTADSGEATGVKWASMTPAAITSTANGVDNRVATYSGTAGLNGEANLTFDGSTLNITGAATASGLITGAGLTSTGDFTTTGQATDWDLVDNNASALSFDAAGKTGILEIVTTDSSEGVTMSGTLGVTGDVDINGGNIDGTAIGANATSTIVATTIDATTDFTVGATIITDGVITDAGGLSVAAAVDLGANTLTTTGSLQVRTIDYSDGDNAITIADGGAATFPQTAEFTSGFDVPSGAEGDVLYHNGTNYVRLPKGDDDEVLTLASGVPSWSEPAGGGDSSANIVVTTGKTVTQGKPVVLNSDGLAEPVDHGRGTQGKVVSFTTTTADGKGSEDNTFKIEDGTYSSPWQHVYDPNAEAHVFFFWLKNANHATDSLAADTYNAVAWVTKWDSATDAWITGPQQTFPDSSDGIDYSQSISDKHSNIEAYYHSLDNTIGVVWVNEDDENLQFTQCKVTGADTSIGLEWAQTVEVDSATERLINFCPAGGTGTTPRWVFYYETTSADSGDLALRMGVSNTFSTSSDALGTIGSEYNIFTGTIDGTHAGYKQHGITYNRSTGSLLIGNSPYYYGGMFKLLYVGDLTTSTSVSSPYGASITSWFYFLNEFNDASNTTAYLSVPNFIALKEDYVDGDYKEKWMVFGPDYGGSTWKMVTFTIDTTTTSGNHPFKYTESADSLGASYQDLMWWNWSQVANSKFFRFSHSHFRLSDPVMGNDHRYVTEVGGAAGAADGMTEFFNIHFIDGITSNSEVTWHGCGWNNAYSDFNSLEVGVPRGVTDNTDFTDINKAPIRGYSPQQISGTYHSRFYETFYPVGSYTWMTSSSWVYDPDAEKWFLFYTGPIKNDTLKSWDFGLLYRQLDMPASLHTTSETQPNLGNSNGTYIGLANSTVTGNGSNTVTVLIPGSVVTGLTSLIPGVIYFTDDTGQIHPRQPSMSMDMNKRIGTALTTTSMKVEDLIEDTLHNETFNLPSGSVGNFTYTYT